MISTKSLKPLILTFQFGSWLTVLPYYWDTFKGRLVLFKTKPGTRKFHRIWKTVAISNIGIRIGYCVLALLLVTQSQTIETPEVILTTFFILIECMATPLHILYFLNHAEVVLHVNALLQLNEALGNRSVKYFRKTLDNVTI